MKKTMQIDICPYDGKKMREDCPDETSITLYRCECGCVRDEYGKIIEEPKKEVGMEKEMIKQDSTELAFTRKPTEVLSMATEASKVLKGVVEKAGLITKIGKSEHLQFEAWQTLGQFYGVTAKVESTTQLDENDEFLGYEASAVILKNSEVISRAEAMCCADENNWKGKPRFQLRSMAQTRACSKALRNVLAWIVVLAGYHATPAEEMIDNIPPSEVNENRATEKQNYAITKIAGRLGWDSEELKRQLDKRFGVFYVGDLTKRQASSLIDELGKK